jgi:amino acid transporter
VFQVFGTASFQSLWYWVLSVTVWTIVCNRTLGVPYDMILRAPRLPQVAERVDGLAHIAADRVGGVHDRFGVPIAALAGFALAALFAIGFLTGIELAQATFMLLFPLTVVGYSTLKLALAVRRRGTRGAELRQVLARRRLWHQAIAILALLAAALVGLAMHPRLLA